MIDRKLDLIRRILLVSTDTNIRVWYNDLHTKYLKKKQKLS